MRLIRCDRCGKQVEKVDCLLPEGWASNPDLCPDCSKQYDTLSDKLHVDMVKALLLWLKGG